MNLQPLGYVAPGFERVAAAFAENLRAGDELGAAFAVTLDGQVVVDLWGGIADRDAGRVWDEGTLGVIFSGTKALVAVCLLILVDRGQLDLEAPVCRYWPEFAQAGKETVRVVDLASHQARLPGLLGSVTEEEMTDAGEMASRLAAQAQDPDPRAADAYHPFTFGWLCGEVVRRVDGRTVGRFFQDEVALPLGLDVWIGLPAPLECRVARLEHAHHYGRSRLWDLELVSSDELLRRVWHNPPVLAPGHLPSNRSDWHRAEMAAAGGIASARSLARLYGCLALGGSLDGVRLMSPDTLTAGRTATARRDDPLIGGAAAYGVGFELQTEPHPFGPPEDAFGHTGAGGSVHCAWPSQRVGLSYVMNRMRDDADVDPRAERLLRAVYTALS